MYRVFQGAREMYRSDVADKAVAFAATRSSAQRSVLDVVRFSDGDDWIGSGIVRYEAGRLVQFEFAA